MSAITALALGPTPMTHADINVLATNRNAKVSANPATTPKTPPEMAAAANAAFRDERAANQTQPTPKGRAITFPDAANRPNAPLFRRRFAAMLGNRLVVMLASVLSTTVTPARVPRLRQR